MIPNAPCDRSEHVLRWTHAILCGPHRPLPDRLAGLAEAVGLQQIGFAMVLGQRAVTVMGSKNEKLPWDADARLLEELRTAATALTFSATDALILASMTGDDQRGDWLVWASADRNRAWSTAERAAFALAGQAIVRSLCEDDLAGGMGDTGRLRWQLAQAAKLSGRLSHDFSNMLTSILGFAELCLTQIPRDTLPARFAREVWQSANDAAHWVRKLQLFCREAKSGVPTDLAASVGQQRRRMDTVWGERVSLAAYLPRDLPALDMDAESLRHVLEQLLQNAAEACASDAVVTIAAREVTLSLEECLNLIGAAQPGNHVEISVTDNGQGMSEDVRRSLLQEVFFSTKGRHRGLGLPVVYGVLRNHGGGFRFDEAGPRGTTVRVYVPVAEPAPAPAVIRQRHERALVSANQNS